MSPKIWGPRGILSILQDDLFRVIFGGDMLYPDFSFSQYWRAFVYKCQSAVLLSGEAPSTQTTMDWFLDRGSSRCLETLDKVLVHKWAFTKWQKETKEWKYGVALSLVLSFEVPASALLS